MVPGTGRGVSFGGIARIAAQGLSSIKGKFSRSSPSRITGLQKDLTTNDSNKNTEQANTLKSFGRSTRYIDSKLSGAGAAAMAVNKEALLEMSRQVRRPEFWEGVFFKFHTENQAVCRADVSTVLKPLVRKLFGTLIKGRTDRLLEQKIKQI